ncbi:MAG: GNAT family N-acetyltransferase [Pseudomonadota bacterium]
MSDYTFRAGNADDEQAIVAINAESVELTAPMDSDRFHELFGMCCQLTVAELNGEVAGFLLGFQDGAAYDSVNYQWFSARFKQFFYVDRIVISSEHRGAGLGQQFYSQLERWATDQGFVWITAEINSDPPNVPSLKFHKRFGFLEIATHRLEGGKALSMQAYPLGVKA